MPKQFRNQAQLLEKMFRGMMAFAKDHTRLVMREFEVNFMVIGKLANTFDKAGPFPMMLAYEMVRDGLDYDLTTLVHGDLTDAYDVEVLYKGKVKGFYATAVFMLPRKGEE